MGILWYIYLFLNVKFINYLILSCLCSSQPSPVIFVFCMQDVIFVAVSLPIITCFMLQRYHSLINFISVWFDLLLFFVEFPILPNLCIYHFAVYDYSMVVFPTDSSGATYVPTILNPSGTVLVPYSLLSCPSNSHLVLSSHEVMLSERWKSVRKRYPVTAKVWKVVSNLHCWYCRMDGNIRIQIM